VPDLKYRIPPDLILPEYPGGDVSPDMVEHLARIRKRFGLIEDYDRHGYKVLSTIISSGCNCFKWIHTMTATFTGQTDFVLPPGKQLEDNAWHIVFVNTDFMYLNFDYNLIPATNTLRFFAGVMDGSPVTIYALRNDGIQDIHYEHAGTPFSPPVLVDRSPGRQLLFSRRSFRFLDSGRGGDEYTVSNTLNTITLTAGFGPAGSHAAFFRLRECGVDWHEEILADAVGQTVFEPIHLGNVLRDHNTGRLIVASRTDFRHPGIDYVTDPVSNTLTLLRFPMGFGQPLNIWNFKG